MADGPDRHPPARRYGQGGRRGRGLARGADLVSFGRDYLANPDLVHRCRTGAPPLNETRPEGFYGGGAHGYTDHPTLNRTDESLHTKSAATLARAVSASVSSAARTSARR
ncbi:hypothetical protein [Streptomyces sp. NPDC091278]|uniref:hypothetical protein n=1 Tax=Streptomyces sp. NPDC091278 TaxID=3155301 RepID=UPI00344FF832